jgi:hypothetical protein
MPVLNLLRTLDDSFSLNDVGSTLLEDLAKGLYQPKEVLREYIQNAVDAHRMWRNETGYEPEGPVQVEISGGKISIIDYGVGMNEHEIRKVKAIAVSKKRDAEVNLTGHKGVGIWAGLSYFETITLISTRVNSDKMYKLTIDFKKIVDSINENTNIGDALNPNYNIEEYIEDPTVHYTMVTLEGPIRATEFFTSSNEIKRSISEICPCKIDQTFVYHSEVSNWYSQQGFELYDIEVDGEQVFRTFPSNVMNFKTEIISINDSKVATCWYAVNKTNHKLESIGNQLTGFRIIQSGFTLGKQNLYSDENLQRYEILKVGGTLDWNVGEIHVVHRELRPNLDRNEFEESELTRQFIKKIREWYKNIEFQTRITSTERNILKKYSEIEVQIKAIKDKNDLATRIDLESLLLLSEQISNEEAKNERNKRKRDVGSEIFALRNTTPARRRLISEINVLITEIDTLLSQQTPRPNNESSLGQASEQNRSNTNSDEPNTNNGQTSYPVSTASAGTPQNTQTQSGSESNEVSDDDNGLGSKSIEIDVVFTFLDEVLNEELLEHLELKEKVIKKFKKLIKEVMADV